MHICTLSYQIYFIFLHNISSESNDFMKNFMFVIVQIIELLLLIVPFLVSVEIIM